MNETERLEAIASDGPASRRPPGPARPTRPIGPAGAVATVSAPAVGPAGPAGPVGPVGPAGLPGATPTRLFSNRDRYSHYGLIDFHRIDAIGPDRLPAFDAALLAKCREWVSGSLPLTPLIEDINTFFAGYEIYITDTDGYVAVFRLPGLTIATRINYLLAMRVMSPGPLAPGSNEASLYWTTVYWTTLIDVLCYRGLQDDMVYP